MTKSDWKIETLKLAFILYAFIFGETIYHAYFLPICHSQNNIIAAHDLLQMSLKQLTEVPI